MAPKKMTTKNPKAASSAPAEKQGGQELKVLNKRLLGKFTPSDWNPNHKMNWGAFLVKRYVPTVIHSKPERKLILGMLKNSHIYKLLSAAPNGLSTLDVLEFYNNSKIFTKVVNDEEEKYMQTEVQGQEIFLDCKTFCKIFRLKNRGTIEDINIKDASMIQGVKELFEAIQLENAKGCPGDFVLKAIRTSHLQKHWSTLALILVRCFDGNKGGVDQISMERWMMMHLLNKKHEGQETHFNWGKYAFNKFLGHIEEFEPKIINGLAEPKANMHFGLRICYILETMGITLRERQEIPVTNSLFRHAFEEKKKLAAENALRKAEEEETGGL